MSDQDKSTEAEIQDVDSLDITTLSAEQVMDLMAEGEEIDFSELTVQQIQAIEAEEAKRAEAAKVRKAALAKARAEKHAQACVALGDEIAAYVEVELKESLIKNSRFVLEIDNEGGVSCELMKGKVTASRKRAAADAPMGLAEEGRRARLFQDIWLENNDLTANEIVAIVIDETGESTSAGAVWRALNRLPEYKEYRGRS